MTWNFKVFKSIQKDSKSIKTDRILIRVIFSTYKTLFGSVGIFWNYANKGLLMQDWVFRLGLMTYLSLGPLSKIYLGQDQKYCSRPNNFWMSPIMTSILKKSFKKFVCFLGDLKNLNFLLIFTELNPSSIYSCSIGHIWEHEFCHLGCWAVKRKFLKQPNFCLSKQLFEVVFSTFWGQKKYLKFF